jgi:hypothetical protein
MPGGLASARFAYQIDGAIIADDELHAAAPAASARTWRVGAADLGGCGWR